MFSKSNRAGFSMAEMLIIIAVIGIISSLAFVSLVTLRSKAREAKRLHNVKQIQKALELYAADNNGNYPPETSFTPGKPLISLDGNTTYMKGIPKNDSADHACSSAEFKYRLGYQSKNYSLEYCLSQATQDMQAGRCIAMPNQLCNQAPCDCNDMTKPCCGWCLEGDSCGGGRLIAKNFDGGGEFYDLIMMPSGCPVNADEFTDCTNTIDTKFSIGWAGSNLYCNSLALGSFNDWQLPSRQEILRFPSGNGLQTIYWTKDTVDASNSYTRDMSLTNITSASNNSDYYQRCVRRAP